MEEIEKEVKKEEQRIENQSLEIESKSYSQSYNQGCNYSIGLSKSPIDVYNSEEFIGPVYVRQWKIIYEDYMPQSIAAFTTLQHDIHFPRGGPHGYFFSHPTFVFSHEVDHNKLAGSPYAVLPTGDHDEFLMDTVAKAIPEYS